MTNQYNFRSECCIKYSQEVYDMMMDCFDLLPLACLVNGNYFCVHGGISENLMDVIKREPRSVASIHLIEKSKSQSMGQPIVILFGLIQPLLKTESFLAKPYTTRLGTVQLCLEQSW